MVDLVKSLNPELDDLSHRDDSVHILTHLAENDRSSAALSELRQHVLSVAVHWLPLSNANLVGVAGLFLGALDLLVCT